MCIERFSRLRPCRDFAHSYSSTALSPISAEQNVDQGCKPPKGIPVFIGDAGESLEGFRHRLSLDHMGNRAKQQFSPKKLQPSFRPDGADLNLFDVSKMISLTIFAIKSVGVAIAALHSRSRHLICRRQYRLNT